MGMNDLGQANRWKWTSNDPAAFFNWETGIYISYTVKTLYYLLLR